MAQNLPPFTTVSTPATAAAHLMVDSMYPKPVNQAPQMLPRGTAAPPNAGCHYVAVPQNRMIRNNGVVLVRKDGNLVAQMSQFLVPRHQITQTNNVGSTALHSQPLIRYRPAILHSLGSRNHSDTSTTTVGDHVLPGVVKRAVLVPSVRGPSVMRPVWSNILAPAAAVLSTQAHANVTSAPSLSGIRGSLQLPSDSNVNHCLRPRQESGISQPHGRPVIAIYSNKSMQHTRPELNTATNHNVFGNLRHFGQQSVALRGVEGRVARPVKLFVLPPDGSSYIRYPSFSQVATPHTNDSLQHVAPSAAESCISTEIETNGVEEAVSCDNEFLYSDVQPIVIMPDGSCDNDENEYNNRVEDRVQNRTEAITGGSSSSSSIAVMKTEGSAWVQNQRNHTIIIDADIDTEELNLNKILTHAAVRDAEGKQSNVTAEENNDMLAEDLRISDIISLHVQDADVDDLDPSENVISGKACVASKRSLGQLRLQNEDMSMNAKRHAGNHESTHFLSSVTRAETGDAGQLFSVDGSFTQLSQVQEVIAGNMTRNMTSSPGERDDEVELLKNLLSACEKTPIGRKLPRKRNKIISKQSKAKRSQPPSSVLNINWSTNTQNLQQEVCAPMMRPEQNACVEKTLDRRMKKIPVLRVCEDGSVEVRVDMVSEGADETENSEENRKTRDCNLKIELAEGIPRQDSVMRSLSEKLGNIHVQYLRNSCDDVFYNNQEDGEDVITCSKSNLRCNNFPARGDVEPELQPSPSAIACEHSLLLDKTDKEKNDDDVASLIIENVFSIEPEKFNETDWARNLEPLPKERLCSSGLLHYGEPSFVEGEQELVTVCGHSRPFCSPKSVDRTDHKNSNKESEELADNTEDRRYEAQKQLDLLELCSVIGKVTCANEEFSEAQSLNQKTTELTTITENETDTSEMMKQLPLNEPETSSANISQASGIKNSILVSENFSESLRLKQKLNLSSVSSSINKNDNLVQLVNHNALEHLVEPTPISEKNDIAIKTLPIVKMPSHSLNEPEVSSISQATRIDEDFVLVSGNYSETLKANQKFDISSVSSSIKEKDSVAQLVNQNTSEHLVELTVISENETNETEIERSTVSKLPLYSLNGPEAFSTNSSQATRINEPLPLVINNSAAEFAFSQNSCDMKKDLDFSANNQQFSFISRHQEINEVQTDRETSSLENCLSSLYQPKQTEKKTEMNRHSDSLAAQADIRTDEEMPLVVGNSSEKPTSSFEKRIGDSPVSNDLSCVPVDEPVTLRIDDLHLITAGESEESRNSKPAATVVESVAPICLANILPSVTKPVSPCFVTEPISPAYVTEPISPAYVTEAISPAYVTEAISPAYVTGAVSPAYVTGAILPGYVTEAISPAYVTEAISPAYVTGAISPGYVTEAISPANVTEAISPAYVSEAISPPSGTEIISPAVEKETTSGCRFLTETVAPLDSPPSTISGELAVCTDDLLCEESSLFNTHTTFNFSKANLCRGADDKACLQTAKPLSITTVFDNPCGQSNCAPVSASCCSPYPATQNLDLDIVPADSVDGPAILKRGKLTDFSNTDLYDSSKLVNELLGSHQLDSKEILNKEKITIATKSLPDAVGEFTELVADESTLATNVAEGRAKKILLEEPKQHKTKRNIRLVKNSSESAVFNSNKQDTISNSLSNMTLSCEKQNSTGCKDLGNDVLSQRMEIAKNCFIGSYSSENRTIINDNKEKCPDNDKDESEGKDLLRSQSATNIEALDDIVEPDHVDRMEVPVVQYEVNKEITVQRESEWNDVANVRNEVNKLTVDRKLEQSESGVTKEAVGKSELNKTNLCFAAEDKEARRNELKGGSHVKMTGSAEIDPDEFAVKDSKCEEINVQNIKLGNEEGIDFSDEGKEIWDLVFGNQLTELHDNGKEIGEITGDSSDEFSNLDVTDEKTGSTYLASQEDMEMDQEDIWHLLEDALTFSGNCVGTKGGGAKADGQRKMVGTEKKHPVTIKLKSDFGKKPKNEELIVQQGQSQDKVIAADIPKDCSDPVLETSSSIKKSRNYHRHRFSHCRKNTMQGSRESVENKEASLVTSCECPVSSEWCIQPKVDDRVWSTENDLMDVARNVDTFEIPTSHLGCADSFVIHLMKSFENLPPEYQQYYIKTVYKVLQENEEVIKNEHVYSDMSDSFFEEERELLLKANTSPLVRREIQLDNILKTVNLELVNFCSASGSNDQMRHDLLILTREMLYDQMNELKRYQKSHSVYVLPEDLRLSAELGKYISVEGSNLFVSKCTLSVRNCCQLYGYKVEIEEMEDQLKQLEIDSEKSFEEIYRKLGVLHLKRKQYLDDIVCGNVQLQNMRQKFSKDISWYRKMRQILQLEIKATDGQEMALVRCVNDRIKKLEEFFHVIKSLYMERRA